jgi:hypothetical protein
MDLQLYLRVIWRFKLLVITGLLLALSLALLSMVKVSGDGLQYRESELWASSTRLLVTQRGFPWGRAVTDEAAIEQQADQLGVRFANPDRFISLAFLYAELATSDPVKRIMRQDGPILGQLFAGAVVQQNVTLPLVDIEAVTTDRRQAIALSERATAAFETYLRQQQNANAVPSADRVVVQVLSRSRGARLFQGRSTTLPIIIFLTVMISIIGLAFILENLRPRIKPVADQIGPGLPDAARRRA